jgi:surface polysaccharide O-acyltransferase-like enzyme
MLITIKRTVSFDVMKTAAIILVIMIHTSAAGYVSFGAQWHAALVYESLSRICVPLFFMVTGALLIPREHSINSLSKRM